MLGLAQAELHDNDPPPRGVQDNAARQAEASQQAEQSQLDAAAVPTHSGLTTPPRHPLQAQQSVGSSPRAVSPLPPVPGRPAMPPARCAY